MRTHKVAVWCLAHNAASVTASLCHELMSHGRQTLDNDRSSEEGGNHHGKVESRGFAEVSSDLSLRRGFPAGGGGRGAG